MASSPAVAPSGRALLAVTVTVLAWASACVANRGEPWRRGASPLALGRLLVGTAVLGLLLVGRGWVRPRGREWGLLAICGIGWFGFYNVVLNYDVALNAAEQHLDAGTTRADYALRRMDAGRLGVTTHLEPPLVVLLGWLLLDEVPAGLAVVGCAVCLAGVALSRRRVRPRTVVEEQPAAMAP